MTRGRKRRADAKRVPSGEINYRGEDSPKVTVIAQRLKQQAVKAHDNDLLGFPLGRLYVASQITLQQFEAGCRFAALRSRYSQIMGFKLPTPRGVAWNGLSGLPTRSEPPLDEIDRAKMQLYQAEECIRLQCGNMGVQEVERVCVQDELPTFPFMLKAALGLLARLHEGCTK